MHNKIGRNLKLWKKRPLSQDLIDYAAEDVSYLLSLADKLTAELGKSQLHLLTQLSQKYSRMFWLPVHRTRSSVFGDIFGFASMFCMFLCITQGSSWSWLRTNNADDAAFRADVSNNEDEGYSDNTAADFDNDVADASSEEEQEDYVYYSEEEDNYYTSNSEEDDSSDDDYWEAYD